MMNKKKEQIIKYIDGSMSGEEKLRFESQIKEDPELQKETEKLKGFLSEMRADAEPEADETYFINMLPEFYSGRDKKKRFSLAKLAYSLSTAAAVILIVFILFKPSGTINYTSFDELSRSLTDSELNAAFNEYSDQYSINDLMSTASTKTDSLVNNLYTDELDLSASADKSLAADYLSTDDLLSSIDESEANELYSQLINADIIKGVRQ